MTPRGMREQVFGGVLLALGAVTALLARAIGFELESFHVFVPAVGACLVLLGAWRQRA